MRRRSATDAAVASRRATGSSSSWRKCMTERRVSTTFIADILRAPCVGAPRRRSVTHGRPPLQRRPASPTTRPPASSMRRVTRTCSSSERSWVTRMIVPSKPSSAASSCSIAGRSRWFVGSSSTSTLAPLAISKASEARVRSPGDSVAAGAGDVVGDEPELGEQRADVGGVHPRLVLERPQHGGRAGQAVAGLLDLADDDARADACACRPSSATRPSTASSSVVLPEPLAPTSAMRSPVATTRSIGPSVNEPRSTTAPSSRATMSPVRPGEPTVRRSCHGSRGLSTRSSRSIAFSVRAARPASCSVWSILKARMFLSRSSDFFAFERPCVAHSRSRWARPARACGASCRTPRSAPTRRAGRARARRGTPASRRCRPSPGA